MTRIHRVATLTAVLMAASVVATSSQAPADPDHDAAAAALLDALWYEGEVIYNRDCAPCHSAEGGAESVGPALDGRASLMNRDLVIRQVLSGNLEKGMPPFGPTLSDRQIAAVGTFVRNAWDNAFGAVVEADVARLRAEIARAP